MIWLWLACTLIPDARVAERLDTDDDGVAWPGDCDPDENTVGAPPTWYLDADHDGHGSAAHPATACAAPTDYVALADDCDDAHPDAFPGGTESCSPAGVDDDCDGLIDDADPSVADPQTYSVDADHDGVGGGAATVTTCTPPTGHAPGTDDCDDGDPAVSPVQPELCNNSIDDDCDGGPGDCRLVGARPATSANASTSFAGISAARKLVFGNLGPDGSLSAAMSCVSCVTSGVTGSVIVDRLPTATETEAPIAKLYGRDFDFPIDSSVDVVAAGDWNDDGTDDLIVGVPARYRAGTQIGGAYVVYGPTEGVHALDEVGWLLSGPASEDTAVGGSVASLGDINGDGRDDAAISAPGWTIDDPLADPVVYRPFGAVFLLRDPVTGDAPIDEVAQTIVGEADPRYCTSASLPVGAAGDVDGDGLSDLLVGAPGFCRDDGYGYEGRGYLVYGPADTLTDLADADAKLYGEADASDTATALTGAGDVNGDGRDDVLVNQRGGLGSIYLMYGPFVSTELAEADAEILPSDAAAGVLYDELARVGDLDGDGFADIAVGTPDTDGDPNVDVGAVHLLYGPIAGRVDLDGFNDTIFGTPIDGGRFGAEVGGVDVDGDGRSELVVLDRASTTGDAGNLYLFAGSGL
jgi:hypothetical protein